MVVVESAPMTFLRCAFLACFLCSSWGLKTIAQSCDPNDSLALKEFAGNLTNGSIITSWSSKSDCCQWDGVVCGSNINGSIHRRVTMLILSKKGLQGLIPRSLGYLDQLKSLDLSCNHLQGGLPSELSSLKWMEVLDLSHNLLSGPVSGVLSGLISIQSLNISSNLFKEDMFELGGYPNLVVFNISNNSFSGPVTSQICSSSKGIQILDLSMNHLVGNLAGLYNCSKSLQQLHLGSNSLSGSLPDFIYSTSSPHLTASAGIPLYVKRNQSASGLPYKQASSFPPSILLSNNRINGTIPPEPGIPSGSESRFRRINILSIIITIGVGFALVIAIVLHKMSRRNLGGPSDDLEEEGSLPHRLSEALRSSKLMRSEKREAEIIDSAIWDKDNQKQLFEMLEIACRCLDQDPRRRPLIEEVVSWLVLDSKVLDNEL
ncbi:hypothetical protein OIU78_025085 [Salix suchowensis]|nr:hypothetical protein OIU78_025085 [Salix suchowensis]